MHFFHRKSEIFIIVKSVEEIIGENQEVIMQVMRFYKENIQDSEDK